MRDAGRDTGFINRNAWKDDALLAGRVVERPARDRRLEAVSRCDDCVKQGESRGGGSRPRWASFLRKRGQRSTSAALIYVPWSVLTRRFEADGRLRSRINVLRLNDSPRAYATVFYAAYSQPDSLKTIMSYRHAEEISLWMDDPAR